MGISAPKYIKKQNIGKNNQNMKYFIEIVEKVEATAKINPISKRIINIRNIPKSFVIWNASFVKTNKNKLIQVITPSIY